MSNKTSLALGAMAAAALLTAAPAYAQQASNPRTGLVPAKEDRVYRTVLELLRSSGPADGESVAGGELMIKALSEKLTADAKLAEFECYLAGCWIQVVFGGTSEEAVAKSALQLNMEMTRDPKAPLAQWSGPKGRTALLYDEAGTIFEGWFVFVRSRAVSPGMRDKHQIKLARPYKPTPTPLLPTLPVLPRKAVQW